MDALQTMQQRRSCRAFTDQPVSREQIDQLLTLAGLAPSAINMQVWECTAVLGDELRRLGRQLVKTFKERSVSCGPENVKPLPRIYTDRQVEAGRLMAPLLGEMGVDIPTFINQGTFDFYGAPAGLVFYFDSAHNAHRLLDVGILLGYLFLAAEEMGLATCPLGLLTNYADVIFDFLNVPDDKVFGLGVALGYADTASPINRLKTSRAPLAEWVRFYGD